ERRAFRRDHRALPLGGALVGELVADDLKRFVRAALAQLDTVREVVVQKSRAGRIQIDIALLRRQRKDVLAEIGAAVARLAAAGGTSEEASPEPGAPLRRLEALDARIDEEAERARRVGLGVDNAAAPIDPPDDLDSGPEGG